MGGTSCYTNRDKLQSCLGGTAGKFCLYVAGPKPERGGAMSRIAVIDDEDLVRDAVVKLLDLHGYEAISFASAETFLQANGGPEMDCLVVDFRLPGMDGCELIRTLRGTSASTPAVLLSGNVNDSIASTLHGLPNVVVLGKPCVSRDLFAAIESLVSVAG